MRSTFFRIMAAAILWLAGMVALATPANATENDTLLVTIASNGQITTTPTQQKPTPAKAITLPGKTRTGTATNIVCYVYTWGPETDGRDVRFEVMLLCEGGTPAQLSASLDIYHVYLGEWQPAPGSHAQCGSIQSPVLDQCVSHTKCFQAGNYYYGFGTLGAFDDEGVYHEAELWTNPIYLGCTI
jgi:hypothetical protein